MTSLLYVASINAQLEQLLGQFWLSLAFLLFGLGVGILATWAFMRFNRRPDLTRQYRSGYDDGYKDCIKSRTNNNVKPTPPKLRTGTKR